MKKLLLVSLFVVISFFGCKKESNPTDNTKTPILLLSPMVSIPADTFIMGCTIGMGDGGSNEYPTHQVILSSYEISKYEVTQSQWLAVMGTDPSYFKNENKPVEQVSWYEAINFCNELSKREGLTSVYTISGNSVTANWDANGYRLPTEAEWEFAARGGALSTNTKYSGADDIFEVAWYAYFTSSTQVIGTRKKNELGIYDMSGNVFEWCWDWYGAYNSKTETNPRGPNSGTGRVLRGGGWSSLEWDCRIVGRSTTRDPSFRSNLFGFRYARSK